MGLLDEAIREHLELKRRRGGDPAEVARAEHDALGPARRGPEPLTAPAEQAAAHAPPEAEPVAAQPLSEELDHAASPPPAEPMLPPAPEPEPVVEPMLPPAPEPEAAAEPMLPPTPERQPAVEPMLPPTPTPTPTPEPEAQETVAFDAAELTPAHAAGDPAAAAAPEPPFAQPAEPEPGAAAGPGAEPAAAEPDEDVLEETPAFLQETPEHDRLWFEQRPPRDFDFDG